MKVGFGVINFCILFDGGVGGWWSCFDDVGKVFGDDGVGILDEDLNYWDCGVGYWEVEWYVGVLGIVGWYCLGFLLVEVCFYFGEVVVKVVVGCGDDWWWGKYYVWVVGS